MKTTSLGSFRTLLLRRSCYCRFPSDPYVYPILSWSSISSGGRAASSSSSSFSSNNNKKRPNVFITRKLDFPPVIQFLQSVADVEIHTGELDPIPRDLLKRTMTNNNNIQGLLPMLTDHIDAEVMDAAGVGQLKVISNYAVGYNNIDVSAATDRGIIVTNTPEVLDESTADCAFMLMMAVARRLVEVDKYVREGKWIRAWGPKMLLGSDVSGGKTLGIIGLGRIGSEMIPRAKGFKMNVIYNKRRRLDQEKERELGIEYREFDDLLQEADFISLHLPLNDTTRHTIGERELSLMKPTAFLINTARGPVVDEKALIDALEAKTIAGAGLDVLYNEPTEPDNPLLKLDNVVVAPHIGSATVDTRHAMAMRAAENLVAVLRGERPKDIVNPEVL